MAEAAQDTTHGLRLVVAGPPPPRGVGLRVPLPARAGGPGPDDPMVTVTAPPQRRDGRLRREGDGR